MNISDFQSHSLTHREKFWGICYLLFELLFLADILQCLNVLLPTPLPQTDINFLFFSINLLTVLVIFRNYLWGQLRQIPDVAWNVIYVTVPGFFAYLISNILLGQAIIALDPNFISVNDASIQVLVQENFPLMLIGTVIFAPITEECLFRGLLFRGLYDRSPVLAWVISVALFAFIHISGYIGQHPPLTLLLCFVQYLPAGLCLAGAYRLSGSLLCPILIHAGVNFLAILSLR